MWHRHQISRKWFLRLLVVGAFAVVMAGFVYVESAERIHETKVEWGYEGEGAPGNWAKLKPEFRACGLGKFQSPVDIKPTFSADLPDLVFDYKDSPLEILNNGHTVRVNFPEGGTLRVGGIIYRLLQLHFHTPSENTINSKSYAMEMHLVHKTESGILGVVGVMIEEGKPSAAAEEIWRYLPLRKAGAVTHEDVMVNAAELLPGDLRYYRFMGSLTTPPCTEGVNWYVLREPIRFSKGQIEKFRQVFSVNARPVQPLNSRMIVSE